MPYGSILSDVVQSSTSGTPPQFNDGNGTQVGTLCRAWVQFNGTSASPITPRAAFNVGSVTKNGTGDYTVNFTNAMADVNFSGIVYPGGTPAAFWSRGYEDATARTTTSWRFATINTSSAFIDPAWVNVVIFR